MSRRWIDLANDPEWLDTWLVHHGLTSTAAPAEVLRAVGYDYQGFEMVAGRHPLVGICGESMPSVVEGQPLPVCELPHGHAGWHGAPPGASGPRWTAEPDVREVGRCRFSIDDEDFCQLPKGHTGLHRAFVGEHGPELLDLTPGATIHPQPEATDG